MAFWPFTKKAAAVVETRDIDIPDKVFIEKEKDNYEWSLEEPHHYKQRINELLYGFYSHQNFIELFYSLPEIFAPVHEIAKRVADAQWELRKDWNDEVDYNDETFNKLFSQPNPLVSFKDHVYQAVCYEILTGKQLWFFNKPSALPDEYKSIVAWWNLPAHLVTAEVVKGKDPYTATTISDFVKYWKKGTRTFDTDRVLPICNLNLSTGTNINDVKSLLLGAEKAIKNLIPVYEARGVIYIKRGAMGFLVSNKKDDSGMVALTKKEKQELNNDVDRNYGLTNGKSTIGVTNQPVSFVKTSMSISEMQPFDETLADANAIYKVLRVPKHLVPSKDNSTFANADADMKAFYTDVIIPWASRYAEMWTSYMKLKDFRRYIKADYSHISFLQVNRKEKADVDKTYGDVWKVRWEAGTCSLNEWITANDGTKGVGPLFDKKLFEMTPEELDMIKLFINLKSNANTQNEDTGTKKESGPDKL